MWDHTQTFWGYVLVTLPGGQVITAGQAISVLLLLIAGYLGSRLVVFFVGRYLTTTKLRPDAIFTLKRIVFFTILVLVFFTILHMLGIPITAFAFAVGTIAIGVGFGAQNIINNFISGWILMAERPIRINDFIEFDSWQGVVEHVGNRSTRIRRIDGVHLLVPNSHLLERTVVNWTLVDRDIRTTVRVGVQYGSSVSKVSELILQAVTEHPGVKPDPKPSVCFEEFGDNALIFDAYFWSDVAGEKLLRDIRSDIRSSIKKLFDKNGIVIAFPQRDVHLDTENPIEIRLAGNRESPLKNDC